MRISQLSYPTILAFALTLSVPTSSFALDPGDIIDEAVDQVKEFIEDCFQNQTQCYQAAAAIYSSCESGGSTGCYQQYLEKREECNDLKNWCGSSS